MNNHPKIQVYRNALGILILYQYKVIYTSNIEKGYLFPNRWKHVKEEETIRNK